MDLAIYINELLGLKGEVNVPGVGFFAQKRVNGYYNETEGKFYPPKHEIVFDPASRDDDGLAEYISHKKNISPASAKYFIEKYATGLKQEATTQSAAITGLGHLYYEFSALAFKADQDAVKNDPAFYGLKPVEVYKKSDKPKLEQEAPPIKKEDPKPEPVQEQVSPACDNVAEEQQLVSDTQPAYGEEIMEEPVRNKSSLWIIVLLIIMIGLLCFGVAYQYKPEWFGKHKKGPDTMIIINGPAPVKPDSTNDTTKANKTDTSAKVTTKAAAQPATPGLVIDSTKSHWEVSLGSFKTRDVADKELEKYKSAGVTAFISPDASKKHVTIVAGSYDTRQEAEKVVSDLIKGGKVDKNIYPLEIKPKK